MNGMLNISSSPHARDRWTTAFIMHVVALSLLPATIIGVVVYGIHALFVVLTAVVTAVLTEFLFDRICRKPDTWKDGSAVVTGLMLALSLSPSVPVSLVAVGSVFAILVVKCFFGGLGKNFVNPALAGRCFLLISFGRLMNTYHLDGVSTATPIAELNMGHTVNITQLFLGTASGVIGSSVLALLVGGLVLWALDIIHGEICFSVLGAFTLLMGLFGGQGFDPGFLLAHLCGGGVIMGAFFMATDYTTSPVSRLGQAVYGILIGSLGALFRILGNSTDSFSYSVIVGNLFVPLIDMFIVQKPYAYRRAALRAQQGDRRSFWQRIPRPVITLGVITLVAGLALSGVYNMTKDTIEEQKRAARNASFLVVCPGAAAMQNTGELTAAVEALEGQVYGSDFGRVTINDALAGVDEAGAVVGYVLDITTADGFDGNISLALGLDAEGRINGIAFTELNETPGMGMRADEPEFRDQFSGRMVSRFVLNKAGGSTDEDQIDAISGASVTSGAVVNAVNAGLDFFQNSVKGGSGNE